MLYNSPDQKEKKTRLQTLIEENDFMERNLEVKQQFQALTNELDVAKLNFLDCNRQRI